MVGIGIVLAQNDQRGSAQNLIIQWDDNSFTIIAAEQALYDIDGITIRVTVKNNGDTEDYIIDSNFIDPVLPPPWYEVQGSFCIHLYIEGGGKSTNSCAKTDEIFSHVVENLPDAFWLEFENCESSVCPARDNIRILESPRTNDGLDFAEPVSATGILCTSNIECLVSYPTSLITNTPTSTPTILITPTPTPTSSITPSPSPTRENDQSATVDPPPFVTSRTPLPLLTVVPPETTEAPGSIPGVIQISPTPMALVIPSPRILNLQPDGMVCFTAPRTSSPFCLDEMEVSRDDYANCVDAGSCNAQLRPDFDLELPMTDVNWFEARDYCFWFGETQLGLRQWELRLPSSQQWTHAAFGGIQPNAIPNTGGNAGPIAVSAENGDITPNGIRHLFGNVTEWTRDVASSSNMSDQPNNLTADRIIRGGNWRTNTNDNGLGISVSISPELSDQTIGFRCALDLEG